MYNASVSYQMIEIVDVSLMSEVSVSKCIIFSVQMLYNKGTLAW
jgi:hypothetical protein